MGSNSISNMKPLPLINFSNLKQETPQWEYVKNQVQEALEEYSFFEATIEEIPIHLRKSVVDGLQHLFDLPLHTKVCNTSEKPYHGYLGQKASVPLYESLGIDDPLSPEKVDTFTNLMWPQGNPTFSKNVHYFAEQLHEFDKIVRAMLLEILGLEKYLDEHMDSTDYIIRFQKYDVPENNGSEVGLYPHTDKNFITILYQSIGGLQVETKDGQWINVGTSPNSFTVIIGEAFYAWTNGRVRATNHRVMMSGEEARYSIGLFLVPKSGYMIKAPEEMVDEDHPLLFEPYDNLQLLKRFYVGESLGRGLF